MGPQSRTSFNHLTPEGGCIGALSDFAGLRKLRISAEDFSNFHGSEGTARPGEFFSLEYVDQLPKHHSSLPETWAYLGAPG